MRNLWFSVRDRHVNHHPSVIKTLVKICKKKKKRYAKRPHRADDTVPASKRMARATGQRTEQERVGWRSSRQRAKTLLLLCRSFIPHGPLK